MTELETLIVNADKSAAVLTHASSGDMLLIPLDLGMTPADEEAARDRHLSFAGVVCLKSGRVIFVPESTETTPEFRAEIGTAFIRSFGLDQEGDGVQWLARLYDLEDPR